MGDQQNDESLLVPIIVFSLASFIGNFGVSVTGFGMAIIFLFVYTIADLANLVECSRCSLRDAVFFQTLALGAAIPLMIFNVRNIMKESLSRELLMTFIPATVVGTPIGNFLQNYLPSDILRTAVGVVITALIMYQLTKLIPKSEIYQRLTQKMQGGPENNDDDTMEKLEEEKAGCMNDDKKDEGHLNDDKKDEEHLNDDKKDEEHQCNTEDGHNDVGVEDGKVSSDLLALVTTKEEEEKMAKNEEGNHDEDHDYDTKGEDLKSVEEDENLPTGLKLRIWGFVMGFLSGFLGGLMGVRGPPLMIFFLMFEYPKNMVRANSVIILFVNIAIRIVYYGIEDLSGQRGDESWFASEYTVLYVCCIIFGILGVPFGDYVATKMNQAQFKLFVAILLLFSGLSNLIKGSINLATSN